MRKSMTDEEEAENPTEASREECLLGSPKPSEPGGWDQTETSLRFGAASRKKKIAGARIEREGEERCSDGTQQQDAAE